MAAGNHLRTTVLEGEILDGYDGGETDHRPRPRHRVERIVGMPGLRCFARPDHNGLARRKQEIGQQLRCTQGENTRVLDDILEHPVTGNQRVDALGGLPLKGISPAMTAQPVVEQLVDPAQLLR